MSVLADLHTHTTVSDGQYTPTELVQLTKQHGIQVLAVTDHDTISGVNEAQRAGDALGLQVIRGVELSAKEYHNFHILGYGFWDGDTELSKLCEKLRAGRDAIECYYPKYTPEQQAFYLRLAEKYKLHQTGGSDFHGEKVKPDVRLTDT